MFVTNLNLRNNTARVLSSSFIVEQPSTTHDFEIYYQLRYQVLRKPWGQPLGSELDETDNTSIHAFIKAGGKAIACARLHWVDNITSQIRYMAVHPDYQGRGLGKLVINYLEEISKQNNRLEIILHARENAVDFYKNCGYTINEKSYLLWGKIQHFLMQKHLRI
ncbi:MAG TPA: GNAT family N-acetyltransferase [Bacteroidia bacterium]|jgi:predicted GNAT family N-acyltransferase|nr:GNAT family N-acetyltransferase [Bacteroidia bacterium]